MGILDRLLSSSDPFLSDGGMETDLTFHEGADLPLLASFVLLESVEGREMLRCYVVSYLDMAQAAGRGFVLGTPTWRANGGWGPKLGLDDAGIRDVNRRAVAFARDLRDAHPWREQILIEGALGPAGDGDAPAQLLTPTEAARLHNAQLETFAQNGVDIATAFTITHPGEAIGMINRARDLGLPFALSFTVETDGRLPAGQDLDTALDEVETAAPTARRRGMLRLGHAAYQGFDGGGRLRRVVAEALRTLQDMFPEHPRAFVPRSPSCRAGFVLAFVAWTAAGVASSPGFPGEKASR